MWQVNEARQTHLKQVFDHLHRHPEVSHKEFGTRDFLLPLLEAAGCRVTTFAAHAGIVADWGDGAPRVGVRGDMDALPQQQADGSFCAVHSCGHDAHMTMALGTLYNLIDHRETWSGAVRLVFQPAEEKGTGALAMLADGAMDGLSHFYGVHLRPERELAAGLCAPAILHGSCGSLLGTIHGRDVHAGRPHLGPNAIETGAALVRALRDIHLDPMIPYSVKPTAFHAGGTATNIIPGSATFAVDLRAQTNDQMARLIEETRRRIDAVADLCHTRITHDIHMGTPAAEVHPEARDHMAGAIRAALGEAAYHPPVVTGGGDDFHYYTVKRPGLKATMLALGCGLTPGLHDPEMHFDHAAMFRGIQVLTGTVVGTLHDASRAGET